MTISEIKEIILNRLMASDTLLASDLDAIQIDIDSGLDKKLVLTLVLRELESEKIVKRIYDEELSSQKPIGWILNNPLSECMQNVYISYPVANVIAETINIYCKKNNIPNDEISATAISEREIVSLISIVHEVLQGEKDDE